MYQSKTKPGHYIALDSWRGICALMVAIYHFPVGGWMDANALISNSLLFVDFFFVLSGFVIAANYVERLDDLNQVKRFAWLRIGRLYPLHLAILMAFVAYECAKLGVALVQSGQAGDAFAAPNDPQSLVANLFLAQGLGVTSELTWNWPAWSISTEMFAYLSFALIVAVFGRHKWAVFSSLIVLSFGVLIVFNSGTFLAMYDFGIFRCYAGFFTGALVYKFYSSAGIDRHGMSSTRMATVLETLTIISVILFVSAGANAALTFAAPLVFGVSVLVFASDAGAISKALRHPGLTLMGALSYSIYMTHVFVIDRFANIASFVQSRTGYQMIDTGGGNDFAFSMAGVPNEILAIGFLACVIGVSYLTYRWIELPCRNAARRMVKPRAMVNVYTDQIKPADNENQAPAVPVQTVSGHRAGQ